MSDQSEFLQRLEIEHLRLIVKYKNDQIKMQWKFIAWLYVCIVVFYLIFLFEVAK